MTSLSFDRTGLDAKETVSATFLAYLFAAGDDMISEVLPALVVVLLLSPLSDAFIVLLCDIFAPPSFSSSTVLAGLWPRSEPFTKSDVCMVPVAPRLLPPWSASASLYEPESSSMTSSRDAPFAGESKEVVRSIVSPSASPLADFQPADPLELEAVLLLLAEPSLLTKREREE
jgi:hypothetical protein